MVANILYFFQKMFIFGRLKQLGFNPTLFMLKKTIKMRIANPIYDVVFKYLMKHNQSAKLLLSAILGREISSLQLRPTEHEVTVGNNITVLRIDFSATIKDKNGNKELVTIELQKAKLASDIMRFRTYLGEQYRNKNNFYKETAKGRGHKKGKRIKKALPIVSIYFLGYKLNSISAPVVHVNRKYYDVAIGKEIVEREDFIESLTHDSYVIQIPYLTGNRRTELEHLLSVFDQSQQIKNGHILEIDEQQIPAKYQSVVRKLLEAGADEKVRETMQIEDEILEELQENERIIAEQNKELEEKNKIIEQKDKTIEENQKAIEQKDKTIGQNQKAIEEKDKLIETMLKELEALKKSRSDNKTD